MSFLVSLSFLFLAVTVHAQRLTRTEKKIVAKVKALDQESIDFWKKS